MAQRIVLVDDLDQETTRDVRTVTFGWDGDTYEIDLNEQHLTEFARLIALYREHGRMVERGKKRTTKEASGRPHVHNEAAMPKKWGERAPEIRAWAKAHGIACPDSGRIPRAVTEAFEKAVTAA